ncbi:hypothetical protein AC578_8334 [Pseudocercospora eumusae]|uniref:Glycosyl transferase CAP10 domain-containing protein n=1 Tax=Pseudocercospora eumusae TaxID=321146 RepID=A0A139GWC9_9PEZI|nr:hypothetical protein AC578_8334 [Pseudocercospora eumusae]
MQSIIQSMAFRLFVFIVMTTILLMYGVTFVHTRGRGSAATGGIGIESLLHDANRTFTLLLAQQTHTYEEAAQAYRERRKRCPPPGFRRFHQHLIDTDSISIEAFWDQIYVDLEPFWALPPSFVRALASTLVRQTSTSAPTASSIPRIVGISIRQGQVRSWCEPDDVTCPYLTSMLQRIAALLPDIDLAINAHASPRVLVPSGVMEASRQHARALVARAIATPGAPAHVYSGSVHRPAEPSDAQTARLVTEAWDRVTVPRDRLPDICSHQEHTHSSTHASQSVCSYPHLAHVHGALLAPNLVSSTRHLLPIFSDSHIRGVGAEITVPALHYWMDLPSFSIPAHIEAAEYNESTWMAKQTQAYWRGSNTGGRHRSQTWTAFHRHRFVALTNATYLQRAAHGLSFDWANASLSRPKDTSVLEIPPVAWMSKYVNTAFTTLRCGNSQWNTALSCKYLENHFRVAPQTQFEHTLTNKYLLDIDGNSYSARYRALLLSGSVVMKATIFDEWHDARLVPWKHYVPLDMAFGHDLWEKLCFFIGSCCKLGTCEGHDDLAQAMGTASARWSRRVLRKVDMEIYWLRLLLEYARIADERRNVLCESE